MLSDQKPLYKGLLNSSNSVKSWIVTYFAMAFLLICGCTKTEFAEPSITEDSDFLIETRSHNNSGFAMARGIIPSGEYAGQRFRVRIRAEYSAVGAATLISGRADIRIGRDRFTSVFEPALSSFCCGEGGLFDDGLTQIFSVFGQIQHTTDAGNHNHLFAASATSDGEFNFSILDQTGSVVIPADPPHDPGIGEIFEIPAHVVRIHIR